MSLSSLYVDPGFAGAFTGQNNFYSAAKENNQAVKRSQTNKILRASDAYTLHKPTKRPARYRRIYTKGIRYLFQIDLVDMSAHAADNDGYKWIVMCIDTFTKFLWAFKMKNKTAKSVFDALEQLLTAERPIKIETDQGGEFLGNAFQRLLRRLNITHYTIASLRKCAIVERCNR